ncbi:MAG TPA: bifunctional DNA-formamidopyrimidine glycosylase/DNA-(apurinic or apyrimidinic site) lyase [Phototrophicaceae bacterium]|nr:bifunctional DNA-formamidopyrimidine glycosylase/DNA-(apurinic or apyrimidinic site) lyase [Phototrophicaceae bacterium]
MPELPEVETVVRGLREPLIGRTVQSMWYDPTSLRTIHSPSPEQFAAQIEGQTFRAIGRRAKYILCQLDHDLLVVHLKMTGRLYVVANEAVTEADRWLHFCLQLDNGTQLRFSDARKFGFVSLTPTFEQIAPELGPEPLADEFTAEVLRQRLRGHNKSIKALLLDQAFVAGVGNIYADEALYRAQISPLRPASQLSDTEIEALHQAIRDALNLGIVQEGASINWYRKPDGTPGEAQKHLYVYGRDGEPCERCGETIVKIRVAQRGTHYCPSCQQ